MSFQEDKYELFIQTVEHNQGTIHVRKLLHVDLLCDDAGADGDPGEGAAGGAAGGIFPIG